MKLGFELEEFVTLDGNPVLVPASMPKDECGWLVETRSEPHTNVTMALMLLMGELELTARQAKKLGVTLVRVPLMEISRDLKVQAARVNAKGLLSYRNIYGFETHRAPSKLATASLHVSFTNEQSFAYTNKDGREITRTYPGFVDHAKLIVGLDKAFATEIKAAKRNPGFYEVKSDGRIEYRSLPNTVEFAKLDEVLSALLK